MPDLILIYGPPAVGKMTVGQALEEKTGYKLFHNHVTIELLLDYFEYGSQEYYQTLFAIRNQLFHAFAKSSAKGYVFTLVWNAKSMDMTKWIASIAQLFKENGGKVRFVELFADLATRKQRNLTENRLNHKKSKRDLATSKQTLLDMEKQFTMNGHSDFIEFQDDEWIAIDNTKLAAEAVAYKIIKTFTIDELPKQSRLPADCPKV